MSDGLLPETGDFDEAQMERTERAKSAIHAGKFHISRVGPQQWTVKNGEKLPYAVSLQPIQGTSQGDTWVCTCMDYQQHGSRILCKHIEGVRLSEAAQNEAILTNHKEHQMDQPDSINITERFTRILWELRQPLDMSRVKRRQAPGLGSVPYLEGYDVIDRANAIFGFAWSFDLIGEPLIVRWRKKVLAWNQQERRKVPITDANGNYQTEEVGLVYITGKVTIELDGKLYSHADLGRCIFSGDTPEALDMALAGSATDCLKRCFRQLGEQFGNSLYDKEIAQMAGLENGSQATSESQPNRANATSKTNSNGTARVYADGTNVNGNVSEQEAYDTYRKAVGSAPASKDSLRSWIASQRPNPVAA